MTQERNPLGGKPPRGRGEKKKNPPSFFEKPGFLTSRRETGFLNFQERSQVS
ncbi:hypothetical protein SPLC1_S531290 [Arthrospira platensis C1]|nr:hypothetical protein SPLC1_S531290 [Arthrospira platensis C1]